MSPTVVCLTPVKNEEWILDRFLQCASLWADHIIIADQNSTDASREIAREYDKVHLIENPSDEYDESARQQLLIDEARKRTSMPRILVALDADEVFTANVLSSQEWEAAKTASPGTVIEFPKIELLHSPKKFFRHSVWDNKSWFPLGYIDDGVEYSGQKIHSNSVPVPDGAPHLRLNEVGVLHYQFCDWSRMESKHRWYRCYERLQFPEMSPVRINRKYSWMYRQSFAVRPTPPEWIQGYEENDMDMTTILSPDVFWWDWEVLQMFKEHGESKFRGLDIWGADWEEIRKLGVRQGRSGIPETRIQSPQQFRHRMGLKLAKFGHGRRGQRLTDTLAQLLLDD